MSMRSKTLHILASSAFAGFLSSNAVLAQQSTSVTATVQTLDYDEWVISFQLDVPNGCGTTNYLAQPKNSSDYTATLNALQDSLSSGTQLNVEETECSGGVATATVLY